MILRPRDEKIPFGDLQAMTHNISKALQRLTSIGLFSNGKENLGTSHCYVVHLIH